METKVKIGEIEHESAELIVVPLLEGTEPDGATAKVDRALGGRIGRLVSDGDYKGKAQETALLYSEGAIPAKRVLIVGLGKKEKLGLEAIRVASATAAKRVRDLGVTHFCTAIYDREQEDVSLAAVVQAMVEGSHLTLYAYQEFKTQLEDKTKEVHEMTVVVPDPGEQSEVEEAVRAGMEVVAGVCLARDLANRPANHATPAIIAEQAISMADELGMSCQVLDEDEMEELGMGALLSVAQGSDEPAKLVILEHNAGRSELDTVVLVGKGITFDAGGTSLKQPKGMWAMKADMAAGGALLGVMRSIAGLDLPIHIVGLVPFTENMPSGKASRPGDVVRAMNGTTIEIVDTDAEGRLTLADGLAYAARFEPQALIDIATLTGESFIALGYHATPLVSNDDILASRLEAAGQTAYERVWRLPMFEEYGEQIKSQFADIQNLGGRGAGTITSAFFLSHFVGDVAWAHLDIAMKAWTDDDKPYSPKWATGYGVRLLVQFLRDWADSAPVS